MGGTETPKLHGGLTGRQQAASPQEVEALDTRDGTLAGYRPNKSCWCWALGDTVSHGKSKGEEQASVLSRVFI